MYQILPHKLVVAFIALLTATLAVMLDSLTNKIGLPEKVHYIVIAVDLFVIFITWRPVWLLLWNRVPGLASFFPDINGEYDVELRHNWPIQERMLAAARGGSNFDPTDARTKLPELGVTKLRARIDAGFYAVYVEMWAENPGEPDSIINRSRTLVTALKRPCDGQPHRLIYVYQQNNRRDRLAVTDDSTFEGAAMLDMRATEPNEFKGEYWTNRAWHHGLSTAGLISFRKREDLQD